MPIFVRNVKIYLFRVKKDMLFHIYEKNAYDIHEESRSLLYMDYSMEADNRRNLQDMGTPQEMGMPQNMRTPQEMGMQQSMGRYVCGNYYCMAHVIRPGDTLYKLSREYGVKVSALMMANPFVDIYNLRIGDELCIPRLRSREEAVPMPAQQPDTMQRFMDMSQQSYENQRVVDAEMNMQEGINRQPEDNTY